MGEQSLGMYHEMYLSMYHLTEFVHFVSTSGPFEEQWISLFVMKLLLTAGDVNVNQSHQLTRCPVAPTVPQRTSQFAWWRPHHARTRREQRPPVYRPTPSYGLASWARYRFIRRRRRPRSEWVGITARRRESPPCQKPCLASNGKASSRATTGSTRRQNCTSSCFVNGGARGQSLGGWHDER